jgi:hypothetical protein
MNDIDFQVARARRRLNFQNFIHVFSWALFAGLCVAVIGLAIPKLWYLSFLETQDHHDAWTISWLIGGSVLSLIAAAVLTIRKCVQLNDAAIEVDSRFGLKERLSSAISVDQQTAESEAGVALLKDAQRSAEVIDVRDKFSLERSWRFALPLIPICLMFAITFLPNAVFESTVAAGETSNVEKENVQKAIKEMQKKIEKKRKSLEASGLEDALEKLNSLQRKFDEVDPEKLPDKKQALVELNDIKKEIEERQRELGGSKELKQALNKLKDVGSGPAKKIAEAMSKGDMKEASKAVKDLVEKLRSGKLSDAEKKKLAKDIKQLANEFKKMQQRHAEKKAKLKKDIEKAMKQGDPNKAAKLQAKLEEMEKQDRQMDKMKKMAQKMQDCANCMKQGDGKKQNKSGGKPADGKEGEKGEAQQSMEEAAESLEDLAKEMQEMNDELKEMEALEDLEKAIGECKGGMNGNKDGKPKWQDDAKGEGRGAGTRSREEDKTGNYKSRVKGALQPGQTVVTGDADGDNISGRSASEVKDIIRESKNDKADPLENQILPKSQREHAKEYFEKLRGN